MNALKFCIAMLTHQCLAVDSSPAPVALVVSAAPIENEDGGGAQCESPEKTACEKIERGEIQNEKAKSTAEERFEKPAVMDDAELNWLRFDHLRGFGGFIRKESGLQFLGHAGELRYFDRLLFAGERSIRVLDAGLLKRGAADHDLTFRGLHEGSWVGAGNVLPRTGRAQARILRGADALRRIG